MKNKIILLLCIFFVSISCSKQNHVEIRIPIKLKSVIDYKSYDKIFVGDFKIESSLKSFNPETELYLFFTKEFSQSIKRKIEKMSSQNINGETPQSLKERLKNLPNSLFITGELKINIKTRSIVKNVKNKSGAKNKAFVKVQLWDMILTITMTDSNSGEIASQNTFNEKLKDADPSREKYSFKLMFDNMTDRFIKKSTRRIRPQKRFLLLK